ncbi:hypothetical protein [Streptomyces sp. NPDC046887]|uniref:hypothetical protein n=1 Tax=Streptomyces sp. NPDC046887 TaxID=3155472 RepID=UPI0033E8C804
MATHPATTDPRLTLWRRVRAFAVPPSMIETATARRTAGDWAGACAAAAVDLDLDLRAIARDHGRELAVRVRADLRRLAPDLLRWHMPRIAPQGLLRPGLTLTLARYGPTGHGGAHPLHLVVRTAPGWADAGQRLSLALWDGTRTGPAARRHPHPRPDPRFRLDLHRHLWDADRADELPLRAGAAPMGAPQPSAPIPADRRCAMDRWAAEAAILLTVDRRDTRAVSIRLGGRRRLVLELTGYGDGDRAGYGDGAGEVPHARVTAASGRLGRPLPVLPDAATWALPDLELLRAGLIHPDRLHPLVRDALAPGRPPAEPAEDPAPTGRRVLVVDCRGARHRVGLVDGVLRPLDHDPAEIAREELLAALTGTPLPCLQAIERAHRSPDRLEGVRDRLDHGDFAGALALVEGLLGPAAVLRAGPLRHELETAARRRITHGLFRAGLTGYGLGPAPEELSASANGDTPGRTRPSRSHRHPEPAPWIGTPRPAGHRSHPRHSTGR